MKRWIQALREEVAKQADRSFIWLVVAFGAGAALFFAWHEDPSTGVTLGLMAGGAALYPFRRRAPVSAFAALGVMAVALGHGAAECRAARVATPLLERESRALTITADVVEAEKRAAGNRIVLANFTLPDLPARETPKRLRISIPQSHGLPAVGQRISLRAVVRRVFSDSDTR